MYPDNSGNVIAGSGRRSIAGLIATLAGFLSAVGLPAPSAASPKVLAAYVLYGQSLAGDTVPMARVVLDDSEKDCPNLVGTDGDGADLAMSARDNPDPKNFPLRVCEAVYPTGRAMRVKGTEVDLPAVVSDVTRITVFGDTGCRAKKDKKKGKRRTKDQGAVPECGQDLWPFPDLAKAAAADSARPDLILHMGDYNYRGTPGKIEIKGLEDRVRVYDAGDNAPDGVCRLQGPYYGQNSTGSRNPDRWGDWQADFFDPAEPLMRSVPWVFARGNHELCGRAGPGWFYLLDPGSRLLGDGAGQMVCPSAESEHPLVFSKPYRLDLGRLVLMVLDSAAGCDSGNLNQADFDQQFARMQALMDAAPEAANAWMQSHRPLWGVVKTGKGGSCDGDTNSEYDCINATLQSAYHAHPLARPVDLVISGHLHRFQATAFNAPAGEHRPGQLVIGNGGVGLAKNRPDSPYGLDIDGMAAVGFGLSQFGYMRMELSSEGGWSSELVNPTLPKHERVLARCSSGLEALTGICEPVLN